MFSSLTFQPMRLFYVDHIHEQGRAFFEKVCELSHWIKLKNPAYSQAEGREELFERPSVSL